MSEMNGRLLNAAIHYAELGYPVFPCVAGGKAPLTKRGFKDATTDTAKVEAWWTRHPDANIGIPMDGLLAVDVDGDKNPWLADTPQKMTDLARGPLSLTPSGGRHHLFRQPEGRKWGNTAGKLAPKVDTRAGGGYIVVPPSVVGGKSYAWAEGYELDGPPGALPEPPAWLVDLLDGNNGGLFAQPARGGGLPRDAPRVATCSPQGEDSPAGGNIIPSGQRNATLARLAGNMRRVGMGYAEIRAALVQTNADRCKPPVSGREVDKIAASICRYEPDQVAVAVAEDHWTQDNEEAAPVGPPNPGPFPERFLQVPGFIGEVVQYNLETAFKKQPVLALGAALCLQAVLAARKVRDPRGNRTNIYILGVARSGRGKDHPRKVNKNVLFHAGLGHLEGNEEFASDSGLLKAVELNPAILFQVDEIGRMLKTIGDARNSYLYNISTALMKLYSSADTVFRGKAYADNKRNAEIDQPCVSLYGLTVPENLYDSLTVENLSDGFLARLMIFEVSDNPPRQRVPQRPVPPSIIEAAQWWDGFNRGGNLAKQHPEPVVVEYTDEAGAIFDEVAEKVEAESEAGDLAAQTLWARVEEKACRLALIYACSKDRENLVIDAEAARWACDLSDYLARRMLWLASQWVADGVFDAKQKKVVRIIRDAGGSVTRNQLCRKTQSLPVRERAEIIENLKATGQIVERVDSTGGRPRISYALP